MTRINTNVSSLNAQKTLAKNQLSLNTAMTRLSTGLRINTGADDPSGMIAAAIQSNDIASMNQAITNTQNGAQLINTADSALGQITNLLSDIRGLVTQVGNTAVVDSQMIAANQLQVDSALQAIDRISQVTKFQGQKILDGSLDFTNTSQSIPQVNNLNVTQANLGTSGQLGVTVQVSAHATQADITTSSGDQNASAALTLAARAKLYTSGGNDVWLQANSNSSDYAGVKFVFNASGTAGAETAAYDTNTKTLTVTGAAGSTWTQVIAAINNDATVSKMFTASGANTDTNINTTGAPLNSTLNQSTLNITALNKGTDYNGVTINLVGSAAVASGAALASYNQNTKVLTVSVNNGTTGGTAANRLTDSTTLGAIATAINNVTLSDGTTKVFSTSYPSTNGASTDRVFGMVASDAAAVANTSVSGYMNSAFTADTRATGTLTFAAGATQYQDVTSGTIAFAPGGGGSIAIKSLVGGTPDVKVSFVAGGANANASATYNSTAGTLVVSVGTVNCQLGTVINAINLLAGGGTAHTFNAVQTSAVAESTVVTAAGFTGTTTSTAKSFEIQATSLSSDFNGATIKYVAGATTGNETALYDKNTKVLTVNYAAGFGGSSREQIATAINNSRYTTTDGTTGALTNAWKATDMAAPTGNYQSATLNFDDTAGKSGTIRIRATVAGMAVQTITVTNNAAATAATYTAATNTLAVNINSGAASTVNSIIAAINSATIATVGNGALYAELMTGDGTADLTAHPMSSTTTANLAGEAFDATPASFTTSQDSVNVQSLNAGSNYNNMQIKFQTVNSVAGNAKALAAYDAANNIFTIQVKNSALYTDAVTLQDISDAINKVKGFAGSYTTKNLAAPNNQSSGVIFGNSINTQTVANTATTGGNTLLADLAVEIGSNSGSQLFNFKAGQSASQITDAINSASDSIGVMATHNNGLVDIKSTSYGSTGFVGLKVDNEGLGGQFQRSLSALRDTGSDAQATINGISANSDGNQLSINTSSLAMNLTMQAETNGAFNFSITGGGAQFQLGPDVVANEQLRIGIQSVNTANLGGVHGKLYELAQGNDASLQTNPNLAAKIVDEASNAITTLRGRLGAISGLTMATNQNTLTDMKQNAQTSLSLIQDTDFAAETANLTRAQILSQANMTVLSIANQQPQQVLSLLPRG